MSHIDLLDQGARINILNEINNRENKDRKSESLRRFEIYRGRQARFIIRKLEEEFETSTVSSMRKILSISFTNRIISEMASIYNEPPERSWDTENDLEQEQLNNLYFESCANVKLKLANRYYKLNDQCALYIVPQNGVVTIRPLLPHQYDVIPNLENPEIADGYIINLLDKFEYLQEEMGFQKDPRFRESNDNINQNIADVNDYKAKLQRFLVWTRELNFIMDGLGNVLSEDPRSPIPGVLPFIDIANEKDAEFFVRRNNNLTDFDLDFGLLLSDTANINRSQSYSQAVITSPKQPTSMRIGPQEVLWMPMDPSKPELVSKFEFVSPNPDMGASITLIETFLSLELSALGIDPKTISGKGEAKSFNSGIERLLSMFDKFAASSSDRELFRKVEDELFFIMKTWSNVMQEVNDPERALQPNLRLSKIADETEMEVKFSEPVMVETKTEKEDSTIKLVEAGLMSRKEAIMVLREVSEEKAEQIISELDEQDGMGGGIGETSNQEKQNSTDVPIEPGDVEEIGQENES